MPLILASASASRRAMLEAAGADFRVQPSSVDETSFKQTYSSDPVALATALAEAKALDVSRQASGTWVIGSDSVAAVRDRLFDKPESRDEAVRHLRAFSGQTLRLISAVALSCDQQTHWSHHATARLHVRDLSDSFISAYLDREWPAVAGCVGVFRIEAAGVQLFEQIEGDQFTIMGMPLLPLLAALRERSLMPS